MASTPSAAYGGAVPIYVLGDVAPTIDPTAFVHPDAVLIGDVRIGAESSIWPGAVLRADSAPITIGARTSIQDNCVIHTIPPSPTVVGDDCVIGHIVHLEGCVIGNGVLVGNAAMVLHFVHVGDGATVAANSVVLNIAEIPAGALALGTPAKVREGASKPEAILRDAELYVRNGRRYREQMRRVER